MDMRDVPQGVERPDRGDIDLLDLALPLLQHARLLAIVPLVVGFLAVGLSFLTAPTFTARTTFLPPQQQQNAVAAALASLGGAAGLAGGALAGGVKTQADQYVALRQSVTVSDRIVDGFKLMDVYKVGYRFEAREALGAHVRIGIGRRDGLITIEVDDNDRQRAADIANRYIEELRRLTDRLALTEAQQRRAFFETQLTQTRNRLTAAQQALQASGFTQGALRAEPKSAAEGYARLKAEATAAEVRLQTLRRSLADTTPEVQQQHAALAALRSQLARAEETIEVPGGPDYIGKYREYKYQETLFELFSRQFELAKLDESRESPLIQVVDVAAPPEWKSRPKRAQIGIVAALLALLYLVVHLVVRHFWRQAAGRPERAAKIQRLRAALKR
jgi:uncharacterized protein involved in exopolysaccharide biosynthesis